MLDGGSCVVEEFGEIVDDARGAVLAKRVALPYAIDADHVAETSSMAGLDAGQRILEYRRGRWLDVQQSRRGEVRVGSGLAAQVLSAGDDTVHDHVEVVMEPGRGQDLAGIGAGG